MDDLRWINPNNYGMKERILELENSGGTDNEIIDALKRELADVVDMGSIKHLTDKEQKRIKKEAKDQSILIYKAIRKINKEEGDLYLNTGDK